MNIGLFGGTFDPPHTGHLIVAQDALVALGLDRILFVPAAQPPHKAAAALTPARDRARMIELAIEGDPRFGVDTLEFERAGPSYTVDTLRVLAEREPGTTWTLLVGADQYAEFDTWRSPAEIRRLARIAVLSRGGTQLGIYARPQTAEAPIPVRSLVEGDVSVAVTRIDISATAVRQRVAQGLPIRYLVPPPVEAFIGERGLYSRNGTPVTG